MICVSVVSLAGFVRKFWLLHDEVAGRGGILDKTAPQKPEEDVSSGGKGTADRTEHGQKLDREHLLNSLLLINLFTH